MPEFSDITQDLQEHVDRRAHSRHRIKALAYVELGENNGGIVLNISEGGFAVRAAESIRENSLSRLRFQMQNATQPLEMSGNIAWTSVSRKEAGVRFVDLREEALLEIRTWISKQISPGTPPNQPPIVPTVFGEAPRRNESDLDEASGEEVNEAEIQGNGDGLVSGSSVIPDSKIRLSDPRAPKTPVERQRYGATLFPKEGVTS